MASMSVQNAAVVICDISNEPMPYRIKIAKLNTFSKTFFWRVYLPYLLLDDGRARDGSCLNLTLEFAIFQGGKRFSPPYFGEISAYWYNCEESHSERHCDNLRANLFCSESDTSLKIFTLFEENFLNILMRLLAQKIYLSKLGQ